MRDSVALERYLERHTETGLPHYTFAEPVWQHVLVLPVYRESPALLDTLTQLPSGRGRTLVILVLNRPDSDADIHANAHLRSALDNQDFRWLKRGPVPVQTLNDHCDLYVHDLESLCGPTPKALGVGLARKTGSDLALQWMTAGGIGGQWICTTDADAILPGDYFEQLENAAPDAVAAVFGFHHLPTTDLECDSATALYELRLHHYVLGLEHAGSPYAYHTLGSCLAIRSGAYTHVRGFPKRAAAEDFYVLNKLAKLGPIARMQGSLIGLQSRHSSRAPFGTGPAVEAIIAAGNPSEVALFYHPGCYAALRVLLASLCELARPTHQEIAPLLVEHGLEHSLAEQSQLALQALGIEKALSHCRRQGKKRAQFQRQFHQWFDAFRTLKFIHALRDAGWPQQSLAQLDNLQPDFWPTQKEPFEELLTRALRLN